MTAALVILGKEKRTKNLRKTFSFMDSELSYKTGGCRFLRIHLEFNPFDKGALK